MIDKISIKNFKIIDSIKIVDVTKINYLIGENGSGKSSILELLSICLGHRGGDGKGLKEVINKAYGTTNLFNNKIGSLEIDFDDYEPILFELKDKEDYINFISKISPSDRNVQCDYYNPATINPNVMVPITPFMETSIPEEPYFSHIFYSGERNFDTENPKIKLFFKEFIGVSQDDILHENISHYKQLSTGYKSLLNLFLRIHIFIDHVGEADQKVFLIEEPEYGLHAKFQRIFSKILDYFIYDNIQFFISTHSSVIINEAKNYSKTKIWFLKSGNTLNLKKEIGKGHNGFSPNESVTLSAELMGIKNEDYGYPENFCLVEESSIIEFLKQIYKHRGTFLKNIFYIAVNGESKFQNYDKTELQKFESQDTLIKCNPFYYDSYLLIIDKYQNKSSDKKLIQYLEKRKAKMGANRFIELSKNGIEDYYYNNESLFNLIKPEMENLTKLKGPKLGKLKSLIAKKVGAFIINSSNPEEAFSSLFENELDVLIKEST